MSAISDAIEASFRQEVDQDTAHQVAEALNAALSELEKDGKRVTIADGTIGLAIYCAHYIEECSKAGEDAPDKELHFFEALGGLIRKFLLRPGGSHSLRSQHDGQRNPDS